ncbi:nuclear transport factor 2 family protein [Streptomyces sp. NPDC088762]|uniref:nuclear transport factor 2 family protein n=1 Tax=Streptomyces sp. NPDC088762 TaxID=3365891 RepID=UPI0037FD931D
MPTPSRTSPTSPTSPTDTTTLLSRMYAAESAYLAAGGPGAASFDLLAPFFAPDVVLHQADGLPYGGTWRGHAGMERFFLKMSEVWESFDIEGQEFLATGATAVVHTQVHARARATGARLSFPVLQTITVRDGRIAEVRPFYWDTGAIARACRA